MSDATVDLSGLGGSGGTGHPSLAELPASSLFSYPDDIAELRVRLATMLGSFYAGITLTDRQLWNAMTAAEADAERRLRVFFSTVEVIPAGDSDPPTEARWIEEPGYDYTPDDFMGNRWGMFTLRHPPIISIQKMSFCYPSPGMGVAFDVPLDWLRADKKYGHVNMVPTSNSLLMPLNAWVLSVLGGGRIVPLMLRVRYKSGIQNARTQYPDLIDLVYRMAGLRLINLLFLPQSGSISADGLSQSQSWDFAKFQQGLDELIDTLRQAIHGVRYGVF